MTIRRSPAGTIQATEVPRPPAGDRDRSLVRRALARLRRDERGTALAELALVMPVVLLVLLGMIDFGKAVNYWIDNTHLANEGARLAAVNNNPASTLACSSGAGATLQDYILQQAETVEQRGCAQGTQRSTHSTKVAICFYNGSTGNSTATPVVGDTVEVLVTYDYDWLRGFPFPGNPSTTITGKAAMRLEAAPTNYSTSGNTGTCPSSA
jgi:Flp pilus assembly protein TadG